MDLLSIAKARLEVLGQNYNAHAVQQHTRARMCAHNESTMQAGPGLRGPFDASPKSAYRLASFTLSPTESLAP